MALYRAKKEVWLSHLCRLVKEGDEFETVFPYDIKLTPDSSLEEIKVPTKRKGKDLEEEVDTLV